MERMGNATVGIDEMVDEQRRKRKETNRKKLLPIVKSVIFCGRQNIPFRGHRDNSDDRQSGINTGNFQALLDFRIDSGDVELRKHFETSAKNAMYRSPTTQNQLINCCGKVIERKIVG